MARDRALGRFCVVGLDGVPCSLLERLAGQGLMPQVAELMRIMPLRRMRASIPEISSVSWTSFATGSNPGVHGIFGFVDLRPDSYDIFFPSAHDVRAATIWDRVGAAGGRSVVINQPHTYPARPLSGSLISGFVALDLARAVHPPELLPALQKMDYLIDVDTERARVDHLALKRDLRRELDSRRAALDLLWRDGDWNYLQVVITGTDRLFHYLWSAVEDEDHPDHAFVRDYFGTVDGFIGEVWQRFIDLGEEADHFLMLSDHGFCAIEREVNLNRWLIENGYLRFMTDTPTSLADISDDSRAFCLDPGRIFIHRAGKFPRGNVPAEAAVKLAEDLRTALQSLTWEGKPVIRTVLLRDEVYAGPVAKYGADCVALAHTGFDLKGSLKTAAVFGRSWGLEGMHTWDDAFLISALEHHEPVFIWDIAGAIEGALGIERSRS